MRGEHCVAGASILSAIAVILLVFANIGQISSGALVKDIYFAEVNVAAYGNAYKATRNSTPDGLYDTSTTDKLGTSKGLRQYYRYGMYKACGYQKSGNGVCNATDFGYPMEPLSQLVADVSTAKYKTVLQEFISNISPKPAFYNNTFNHNMSRAGSLLIFVGSCLAVLALLFGVFKARIFFLVAAACSGVGAFLLLIGAALWTSIIAKDAFLNKVKVTSSASLGINVYAGPSLYLTWVAFALLTLSTFPYVIACCTFRRN